MKIIDFESGLYRIPLTENWGSSNYAFSSLEFVVVWLKTDTGHIGTGWTFSTGNGGSAFKNLIDHYLAAKVMGEDPLNVERLWNRMWLESHDIGSAGVTTHAIAAVDIALWDLIGQQLNQPLFRLLGGYRDTLPGYGSGVNLHLSIDALLAQMEGFLSAGYRTVKMKIGSEDAEDDLVRLLAVRNFVGPSINIAVDANKKWSSGDAARRMAILNQVGLYWLEEPLLSDDIHGHRLLRQKCPVPVAVGESLYTKYQFAHWIRQEACDYIQPDVYRVGGITEFVKIAKLAESHNIPVIPHFGMELMAHLGCGLPNIQLFEGLKGASLREMGIISQSCQVINGNIRPGEAPGHGITFDRPALARYAMNDDLLRQQNITTRTDV
ncbi:TPA: mandelate racemase/muconate lactonizing enzyme family protein [Klebsiella quasipneumoniae subsp. similipneumoniae]|nr:mandelate racemase/muconate lactonizing enzyme family protein [Klebsiella quasipneumoniae subsp. similipneumoniae]